ncbi:hypothetical protein D3C75_670110 [compost metagenome]
MHVRCCLSDGLGNAFRELSDLINCPLQLKTVAFEFVSEAWRFMRCTVSCEAMHADIIDQLIWSQPSVGNLASRRKLLG